MKLRILGCGTSSGVPRIGNDWGLCDPAEPRNRRSRASVIVESHTTRILVDTAPDLREQLLAADIDRVDAIIWTHDHADHCHGIDDVRQLFHATREPITGYGFAATIKHLTQRFAYAFEGRLGYPSILIGAELTQDLLIGDIMVRHVVQPHGPIFSAGLRFEHDEKSISYSTDFHEITDAMKALYDRSDIWVVDALREKPHPTHAHLDLTLDAISTVRPGRAILTHMDQSMDYGTLRERLPQGIEPGYDGLQIML